MTNEDIKKKAIKKRRLTKFLCIIPYLIIILIVLALIGIEVAVWVMYGNKAIDEVPMWALIFMFGGKQ